MSWRFHPDIKTRGRVRWLVVMEIHLLTSVSSCIVFLQMGDTTAGARASGSRFSCRVSDSLARVMKFGKCQSNAPAFPLNSNLSVSPTPFDYRVLHPAWLHGPSQA